MSIINARNLSKLIRTSTKSNSPLIFTVLAGVGTIATAYLASKASFKAAKIIQTAEELEGYNDDPTTRKLERVKLVWKCYIPTAVVATSSVACAVASNRLGVQKTIAAQSALAITQQAYSDYRTRSIEQYGDRKDQAIMAAIAEDHLKKNPPPSSDILVTGPGNQLCCELYTGRYFACDIEKIRKSVNEINAQVLTHGYATLTDFYYKIGIPSTSQSSALGWKDIKLLDMTYSPIMTEDGTERACIAFEYNYVTSL